MWKTTQWSQIIEAQQQNQQAIENLCQDYWMPVYKFTCKYYKHDAEDIVQEFFIKFSENKWISRVSKEKGKFRTFLITTLIRFIKDKRQERQGQFEKDMANLEEPSRLQDFNRYWIENLLSLVARKMHSKFEKGNFLDYAIFRMYYYHSQSAFFRAEDIILIDNFLQKIAQEKTLLDQFLNKEIKESGYSTISPTYTEISKILNAILESHDIGGMTESNVEDTYKLTIIDWKVTNWKAFAQELMVRFKSLSKKYKWFDHNQQYVVNFLNRILENEDIVLYCDVPENFVANSKSSMHKNRMVLEYLYPQYIEKYQAKCNRKILEIHHPEFIVPCLYQEPSLLSIASQLEVPKYKVEKSLKESVCLYREIMIDEVSRYVYPSEVSEEIAYLHNLL